MAIGFVPAPIQGKGQCNPVLPAGREDAVGFTQTSRQGVVAEDTRHTSRHGLPDLFGVQSLPGGNAKQIGLGLSTSEFLDRIAALIAPPRKHRQRYFGVLAPNSPWRALVTAQAGRQLTAGSKAPRPKPVREVAGAARTGQGARYMWAQLLACIYGVFALQCSRCGGRVYLVGFITEPAPVREILEHVGE